MSTARSAVRRLLPAVVVAALLVAAWQIYVSVSGIRPQVLPSPARVAGQGWSHRDDIAVHAWATLQVTLLGFAVSLVVAWALAVLVDFSPWLRRALVPLFVVSQTLPIIAIAPLMIIWFGFGLLPKILVIALATFFPMAIGLIEGFASADRDAGALLRGMGASRWQQFRYVRLPSALPRFFTALRIGVTYAVVGAVFAEYVGASAGLGIYMSVQKNSFRTDLVLAAVLVTATISVALYLCTFAIERAVAPWIRQTHEESRHD
ncbi:ABC transporter permease [Prescottella subtropica]|uniref:ABC transporter permease n=1 Tax=Prescottella subtropica TaxID=2545757 RepID=UPI0010F9FA43|nr:ABC transporter permease [Prescottella subtropica]